MYGFTEQEGGPLRVFRLPEAGMVYTIGIDAATGLGEDASAIQVLSNTLPYEQVAKFRSKWPVNDVSAFADKLGRFYHEALVVCEINYPGNSVQDALLQYYKYPRNYQDEIRLDEDGGTTTRYGFRTTEPSKWILINETRLALKNEELIINDPDTVEEFRNFVYRDGLKTGAAEGMNDDEVIALMLAYHGAKLYPFARPVEYTSLAEKNSKKLSPEDVKSWRLFNARLGRAEKGIVL